MGAVKMFVSRDNSAFGARRGRGPGTGVGEERGEGGRSDDADQGSAGTAGAIWEAPGSSTQRARNGPKTSGWRVEIRNF
jgi:hypothetical protein